MDKTVMETKENESIAWNNWIAYRKRNASMTIQEEQEIMEEMEVFDDYYLTEPDEPS